MKIFKLIILSLAISQTSAGQGILTDPCSESDYQTLSAPIQSIMTDMVKQGVPGISLAIYARGELKISTAGYAKIENKTLMQPCHLHYLGSIPKLYMATPFFA